MLVLDWNCLWTVVNILVLYVLLKKFLFGPVTEMMEKRKDTIASSLEEAAAKNKAADDLKMQYEAAINDAKVQADEIIKSAKVRATEAYDKKLAQAHEEANKVIIDAHKAIEVERRKVMANIEDEIIDLTMAATSKVIQKNIDDEVNKQLVDDFLMEVGAAK